MGRPMTPAEQARFKGYFPRLNVHRAVVTDEATPRYNCIAWTIGVTTAWIWPGSSLIDFDAFYARRGYTRSSSGPIAAWQLSGNMAHGCISGAGHGPRWESKCGNDLRIQHGLGELSGSSYGHVVAFYRRDAMVRQSGRMPSSLTEEIETVDRDGQQALLRDAVSTVSQSVVDEFERRFSAWKETWVAEHTAHLSDPSFVTNNEEFAALVALGPEILPLVIGKLIDPDNFLALQLYDAVEIDPGALVGIDPGDDVILEGEQGRARRTVERWIANL